STSGSTTDSTSGSTTSGASSDDHSNTQDGAETINPISTTSGNLEVAGDKDWFKIEISRTEILTVKTTGATDTYGELYNENNTKIAYDNDGGTGTNFKITYTVTSGIYYVQVKHRSTTGTGSYSLVTSLDDYGNTIGDARTVSLGNTTLGNINVAGDEDYFKIVIPSAGTLTVKTTGSTDTYGYLLDASNSEIESNDDGGLDRNFQISKFITTAGTYYVKVKHHSATETGPYSLVVHFDDHNNTQDGATPINPTSTTPGSFEIAGDKDWFKIVISRAGVLEVETTGRIDTNGTLYDASGTQIASNENSGTGNNFKITQTVTAGTYYVKVKHHSTSGTGDYSLVSRFTPSITTTSPEPISDDHGNTKETATLIELNTTTQKSTTSGNIEVAADKDYFEI
ncbi:MAG: pre-peptidase C-terminal domain-containing protein, partial [Sulfurovum sp.]|nr:pre-peptidase C-terminal domain-containing protein [Sulfurovum sp.]